MKNFSLLARALRWAADQLDPQDAMHDGQLPPIDMPGPSDSANPFITQGGDLPPPPAAWLRDISPEPPDEWLQLVREHAPHLLDPDFNEASAASPDSDAPRVDQPRYTTSAYVNVPQAPELLPVELPITTSQNTRPPTGALPQLVVPPITTGQEPRSPTDTPITLPITKPQHNSRYTLPSAQHVLPIRPLPLRVQSGPNTGSQPAIMQPNHKPAVPQLPVTNPRSAPRTNESAVTRPASIQQPRERAVVSRPTPVDQRPAAVNDHPKRQQANISVAPPTTTVGPVVRPQPTRIAVIHQPNQPNQPTKPNQLNKPTKATQQAIADLNMNRPPIPLLPNPQQVDGRNIYVAQPAFLSQQEISNADPTSWTPAGHRPPASRPFVVWPTAQRQADSGSSMAPWLSSNTGEIENYWPELPERGELLETSQPAQAQIERLRQLDHEQQER